MDPDYYIKRVELNTGDESEYPKNSPTVQSPGAKPVRDFKKVMSKTHKESKSDEGRKKNPVKAFKEVPDTMEDDESLVEASSKDDEENAADAALSLFDLSKKASQPKVKEPGEHVKGPVAKVQSPSDLFKTASAAKEKGVDPSQQHVKTDKGMGKGLGQKDKFTTKYTQEQPDLATIDPFAAVSGTQAVAPMGGEAKVERATPLTAAMRDLLEQIVKQMYTVSNSDKTDTVMTLQYPPLFKDARIILSSFETARGQFNISFENLSQAAQRVLDLEENRRVLINSLESKGYNVQIFTTTTILEPHPNVDEAIAKQNQDDQGKQDEDQPRKRKRDEA